MSKDQTKKVEVKKPEAKKVEAKKPEAKKVEAEKVEVKKPEAKKVEVKKPEAKKVENFKISQRVTVLDESKEGTVISLKEVEGKLVKVKVMWDDSVSYVVSPESIKAI